MKTQEPYLSRFDIVFVIVAWIAICVIRYVMDLDLLMQSTGSTDDTMRLHTVRDLIAGKGWYAGLHDPRLAPPEGLDSHWSRLVDLPIAALILIATPFIGVFAAESFAMVAWPALLFFALMMGFIAVGRKLAPEAGFTPMLAGVLGCLSLSFLFRPTAIDHHNLQIVASLWLFVCALWMVEKPVAAMGGGILAALMIAIGIENLHIYAVLNILVVYRAFVEPQKFRKAVLVFLASQAAALILFWLTTVPPQLWAKPMCDAIAVNVILACVSACAVAGFVIARGDAWSLPRKVIVAVLGLFIVALAAIAMEPACLRGPNAMVDPQAIQLWMNNVTEASSLLETFAKRPFSAVSHLVYPSLSLLTMLVLLRAKKMSPEFWALLACVALATAVSFLQVRGATYSALFGSLFVAVGVAKIAGQAATAFLPKILVPGFLPATLQIVALAVLAPADKPQSGTNQTARVEFDYCTPRWGYPTLEAEPLGFVLAHIDMGPALLLHTQHNVMMAPYHRTSKTIAAGFELFATPLAEVEKKLKAAGITHLADCTENPSPNPSLIDRNDKTPILQDAVRGEVTASWLEALPLDPRRPEIKLWRFKP